MKVRNIVAGLAIVVAAAGTTSVLTSGGQADAASATISTSTSTKVMVNSKCYETYTKTVTTYEHSSTKGWVKYPSPKVTTSKSEHCYA